MFDHSFPGCGVLFCFFWWKLGRGRAFPDKLHVSSFPNKFPHSMPGQRHSQPTPTSLGEGYMCVYVVYV